MEENETKKNRFTTFLRECKRVLRVTKKPTKDEFRTIVKVSGLGMTVIGLIGFLILFIKQVVFQ